MMPSNSLDLPLQFHHPVYSELAELAILVQSHCTALYSSYLSLIQLHSIFQTISLNYKVIGKKFLIFPACLNLPRMVWSAYLLSITFASSCKLLMKNLLLHPEYTGPCLRVWQWVINNLCEGGFPDSPVSTLGQFNYRHTFPSLLWKLPCYTYKAQSTPLWPVLLLPLYSSIEKKQVWNLDNLLCCFTFPWVHFVLCCVWVFSLQMIFFFSIFFWEGLLICNSSDLPFPSF